MSQASIIGGIGTALCLSLVWPYCFQKQWGVNGFLGTCPCFAAIPCCNAICSTSSNSACDCGWIGENDHAYFGTDEERAEEEARERAMRLAWANRIVRQRERDRILHVVGGVGVLRERVGQRVHGVTEKIPLQGFGHASRTPGGTAKPEVSTAAAIEDNATEPVGDMSGTKRKNLIQRLGERNLDDIIGGSRLRASRPGSVLFEGAPGVESTASIRRRESSGVGRNGSSAGRNGSVPGRVGNAATGREDNGQSVGNDELPLNRGTMASQTVVQRHYGPTAPMTIASSIPHDDLAPPAYK